MAATLLIFPVPLPCEHTDENDMKLRKEDQDWLAAEISRSINDHNAALIQSFRPHGVRRVMVFLREWGAISAIWAVPLALLAIVITLWNFNSTGVAKNATFQEKTEGRLDAIESSLKEIHRQQLAQTLTNHGMIPLEQFGQSLPALNDALAAAREQKLSLPPNVISDLQSKLIATDHQIPSYWPSAVQMVDYKFRDKPLVGSERNCLDTMHEDAEEHDRITANDGTTLDFPQFSGPQTPKWTSHALLGFCTLDLDDTGNFATTSVGKMFQRVKDHHPQADRFYIVLTNVRVIYSGGKILPVSGFEFRNCTFELLPPTGTPSKPLQSITTQLLSAKAEQGIVSIPVG